MRITIVNQIPPEYQLVTDSQDVKAIKESIGKRANDYDAFFVLIGEGEYLAVYGMVGIVPYLSKLVSKLV